MASGGCEECYSRQCVQAPCNFDCRYTGNGCETLVNGGGGLAAIEALEKQDEDALHKIQWKVKLLPCAVIDEIDPEWHKLDIYAGDCVTHINGEQLTSMKDWATKAAGLQAGDVLSLYRVDGKRAEVTLV